MQCFQKSHSKLSSKSCLLERDLTIMINVKIERALHAILAFYKAGKILAIASLEKQMKNRKVIDLDRCSQKLISVAFFSCQIIKVSTNKQKLYIYCQSDFFLVQFLVFYYKKRNVKSWSKFQNWCSFGLFFWAL